MITHIMDRRSGRKDELKELKNELEDIREAAMDSRQSLVRLQLLNLIQHAPSRHSEILEVAHRYFAELDGNWYMESIFIEWAGDQQVSLPTWFKE